MARGFGQRFLPPTQPSVGWKIALLARRRPSLSPAVESFIGFTREFARTRAAAG